MQVLSVALMALAAIETCYAAAYISCRRVLGEDHLLDKARDGRYDIVSTCLEDTSFRVDDPALLYYACANGVPRLLDLLVSDPEYLGNLLEDGHFNVGNFAMRQALQHGHEALARYMLFLSDVDALPLDIDFNNNEFAFISAANGQIDFLEDLLEYEDVDPDDRNGTALVHAILNGHTDVALLLIDDDRVDLTRTHNTVLATAVQTNNKLLVSVLLEREEVRVDCMSSVFVAATSGHVEILEMFLNDERIKISRGLITQACLAANDSGLNEVVKVLLFDHRVNRSVLPLVAEESPDSFLASDYGQFLIYCITGDYKRADGLCPTEIAPEDLTRLKDYNPFILEFLENRNFI